jgi:hypothetical protein
MVSTGSSRHKSNMRISLSSLLRLALMTLGFATARLAPARWPI